MLIDSSNIKTSNKTAKGDRVRVTGRRPDLGPSHEPYRRHVPRFRHHLTCKRCVSDPVDVEVSLS